MEQQQVNEQAIMQALYAPFPEEMEKVMTLSGVNLKFIPVSEVINRLNKVLGVDGWSFEIISCDEVSTNVDELSAHDIDNENDWKLAELKYKLFFNEKL
jgi:recombination DNA repair RAD52 pathway protein